MPSCLCKYKALVNAYKCEITEKSYFLVVNGYVNFLLTIIYELPNYTQYHKLKKIVSAYKCEITEKSHFLFMNGYKKSKEMQI